jgi:hypothetical protein
MSRAAIAAALALNNVATGERLAAFALASYANREQLAWPGTSSAAARAGLGRSRYLGARNQLLSRGLVERIDAGGGRGRSTTLLLRFVAGRRLDASVNAELFEAVLTHSRAIGPSRLLLAAIAALADAEGQLDGITAGELRELAGVAESTYRRARKSLIASGELELVRGIGGRGNTNCWRIPDPRPNESRPSRAGPAQRSAIRGPTRPLLAVTRTKVDASPTSSPGRAAAATPTVEGDEAVIKGAQEWTVSDVKGAQEWTVSDVKGAQEWTVSDVRALRSGRFLRR